MLIAVFQCAHGGRKQCNHTGVKQSEKNRQTLQGLRKTHLKAIKLCWLKSWLMLPAPSIMHTPAPQPASVAQASLNADPWLYNQKTRTGKKQAAEGSICAPACSEPSEGSCKAIPLLTTAILKATGSLLSIRTHSICTFLYQGPQLCTLINQCCPTRRPLLERQPVAGLLS